MIVKRFSNALLLLCISAPAFAQLPADEQTAAEIAKKYKKEDVACLSSYHYFTFDKGKNALGEKVVVIQEDAEMEFISLKKVCDPDLPGVLQPVCAAESIQKSR